MRHQQRVCASRVARQISRGTFLRVIVASRTPSGRTLPLDFWVDQMLAVILPFAGGATRLEGLGYWLDGRGRLIRETVAVLDVYFKSRRLGRSAADLVNQLVDVAVRMRQDTLAIAVDHRLHLLSLPTASTPTEYGSRHQALIGVAKNGHVSTRATQSAEGGRA